jgi:hypothetical protein
VTAGDTDLEVVWAVLESQGGDPDGMRVRGTGVQLPSGEVLVGSGADGHRHVLIPLAEGAAFAQDTATRGVHITRRRLDTGGGIDEFTDIECRLSHLNPVFATLAEEMLAAAVAAPQQPATACRVVLDRWREFLGSERSPLLSEERTVGLLAELLEVRAVLEHDRELRIDVWAGPSGATHDLRRGAHSIEVKGTQVREGKFVQVNGLEQLVPPPGGRLHLAWRRFERDDTSPLSLPAAIRETRALGVDNLALTERLALAGYDPAHAEEYEARRYREVESRLYEVDDDFPRIVPTSFAGGTAPPGVLRLRYTVDLTNEPPVPLDDAATNAVRRTLGETP